ncbi:hypothetical protein H0G86_003492 [Trichoderma simmonsii]|uniref:Uncharacterized protein n=1 Tax=Trichoderma simmonsii TaxID=1491479 RepID=A0A8G0L5M2_9HYPO|nr:hypothetical protein H0G86_003492 [Trichoderma simmonsii]
MSALAPNFCPISERSAPTHSQCPKVVFARCGIRSYFSFPPKKKKKRSPKKSHQLMRSLVTVDSCASWERVGVEYQQTQLLRHYPVTHVGELPLSDGDKPKDPLSARRHSTGRVSVGDSILATVPFPRARVLASLGCSYLLSPLTVFLVSRFKTPKDPLTTPIVCLEHEQQETPTREKKRKFSSSTPARTIDYLSVASRYHRFLHCQAKIPSSPSVLADIALSPNRLSHAQLPIAGLVSGATCYADLTSFSGRIVRVIPVLESSGSP